MSVAFSLSGLLPLFRLCWADGEIATSDCLGILKRRGAENAEEVLRTFSCSAKGFLTLFHFHAVSISGLIEFFILPPLLSNNGATFGDSHKVKRKARFLGAPKCRPQVDSSTNNLCLVSTSSFLFPANVTCLPFLAFYILKTVCMIGLGLS